MVTSNTTMIDKIFTTLSMSTLLNTKPTIDYPIQLMGDWNKASKWLLVLNSADRNLSIVIPTRYCGKYLIVETIGRLMTELSCHSCSCIRKEDFDPKSIRAGFVDQKLSDFISLNFMQYPDEKELSSEPTVKSV